MIVELFTKKKIVDVKATDDNFDKEYMRRIEKLQFGTLHDLKLILIDYEEFLPEGLQKFREAKEEHFEQLIGQIRQFFANRAKGIMGPSEATEFFMLLMPPLIVHPRMWAMKRSQDEKRKFTWGEAFLELSLSGSITKILRSQELMYKHVINVVEQQKGELR